MKRLKKIRDSLNRGKLYPINEAIRLVKNSATAKFDETIELAVNLNLDPKHADQQLRGFSVLPHGTGKDVRVAVFARGEKEKIAKECGADLVGAEDLMERILSGDINFDRCIASPDMMGIVGRVGKILGPRNLMPNPKLGTVTLDIGSAVKAAKSGDVQYRIDKGGIVHARVGRASFPEDHLRDNIVTLIHAIQSARPSGAKGLYMRKISISSTMGIGVAVDMSSVNK